MFFRSFYLFIWVDYMPEVTRKRNNKAAFIIFKIVHCVWNMLSDWSKSWLNIQSSYRVWSLWYVKEEFESNFNLIVKVVLSCKATMATWLLWAVSLGEKGSVSKSQSFYWQNKTCVWRVSVMIHRDNGNGSGRLQQNVLLFYLYILRSEWLWEEYLWNTTGYDLVTCEWQSLKLFRCCFKSNVTVCQDRVAPNYG